MQRTHSEIHMSAGQYLKDVVYGANDGIITTFAVVAGVAGAHLGSSVVILLGLASLVADGFSMAASNYLGTKSERSFFYQERKTEKWELEKRPKREHAEMRMFLERKGYTGEDLDRLLALVAKNEELWLDIMLKEELGISLPRNVASPLKNSLATFIAFIGAGAVPLLPFLFVSGSTFLLAALFTGVALFVVGALRSWFTGHHAIFDGAEMLLVGGIAAALAYGMGYVASGII